jgi:uncharacterized protein YjbJ (UPF0337 family)
MSTKQKVLGNWNQLKGRIKEQWGVLTDDELQEVEGQFDELVGLIQQKTGQSKQEIKEMVSKLNEETSGMLSRATSTARHYADEAGARLRGASEQVRERALEGYGQAEDLVRHRPAESVATAFVAGLLVGVAIGLFASSTSHEWR